jgi:YD repeat-containing protein
MGPLGQVVTNHFDTAGNLQRIVDPASNQWQLAFDGRGMLTAATDPNSYAMQVSYDVKRLRTTVPDRRDDLAPLSSEDMGGRLDRQHG